ncbi:hypothetical protein TA3x_004256 [Tundrisphaera sp. TA3]|uniref:hypothetical protein n=1 Tax=Tundrisphaera sp. TA3 TaxID=3435775 RepID=UPI003EBD6C63
MMWIETEDGIMRNLEAFQELRYTDDSIYGFPKGSSESDDLFNSCDPSVVKAAWRKFTQAIRDKKEYFSFDEACDEYLKSIDL